MSDLYSVLGLPGSASEEEIKSAYRTLARQLHPDINAGDETSARRLKEINYAYERLGNAQGRAAYDRDLERQRGETRRRYTIFAATTAATFAVTITVVSFAVRWHLQAAAPKAALAMPANSVAPEPKSDPSEPAALMPHKQEANWTTYRNVGYGFALRYPAGVFAFDVGQSSGNVRTFVSRDGRAVLRIHHSDNTSGMSLTALRRVLVKKRYAGASFERAAHGDHWFALSGTRGDSVFFERVTFSCDRKSMHGWQMTYPSKERATYDKLAKLVLRNYPHGNGPGAGCDITRRKPSVGWVRPEGP
jgi:curved DNA-binding protein CbpA